MFLLALGLRLGFVLIANEPPLYAHPYHYYRGAFLIVEHPEPLRYVFTSDEWRAWGGVWTLAPLYFVFMAGVLELFGPDRLLSVHVVQCLLEAGTAVLVAVLGRALAGPRGAWAGVAYALYWPAVELPSRLLTENVQTVLLVGAIVALARGAAEEEAGRRGLRWTIAGAVALGVSALARAVGFAFLPLAALWRFACAVRRGPGQPWALRARHAVVPAAVVVAAGMLPIAPWWARNALVMHDPSPIESVSVYNVWANYAFVNEGRFAVQQLMINKETDAAGRRARAMEFAWRGITRRPEEFPPKVWTNFRHFLRPEGLHTLLTLQQARPSWGHWTAIGLEDLPLLLALPAFLAFVVGGRPSPARGLTLLWCGYYLFMVIVVFHNEIRYRSAVVPFLFAGAAGGIAALGDPLRRRRAAIGLAVGAALSLWVAVPYAGPAWAAWRAKREIAPARAAVARGDLEEARARVLRAAALWPGSSYPWLTYGRWLAEARRPAEALAAYEEAARSRGWLWLPRLVRPRLLQDLGRTGEMAGAVRAANGVAWAADPWLALEAAWRELPAPRTGEFHLGWDDHGAVRGFLHPHGDRYRWTRGGRSWLRLVPPERAAAYDVTLEMSSPPPSPRPHPEVEVRVRGGAAATFTLSPERRAYTLRTPAPAGEELRLELRAPTWNRSDAFADQGVVVERVTVAPAR